jgi:hypothetical protein
MAEFLPVGFIPFEPKIKNRYIFSIHGAGGTGMDAYLIKTAARPSIEFEEITLEQLNLKRYVKGKATWQPITITLYDPIIPSAAQSVIEWIKLSHEALTGKDGYAVNYKKTCNIQVLGPAGDLVEEWELNGTWIQSANFNDLDFTSSDPVDIELALRYDYATLMF